MSDLEIQIHTEFREGETHLSFVLPPLGIP